jgi:UV DNA damage repair endonuclease
MWLARAVENDDIASAFSLEDLLYLNKLCGVPLVFDFHHHKVRMSLWLMPSQCETSLCICGG